MNVAQTQRHNRLTPEEIARFNVLPGRPYRLGAVVTDNGTRFSVVSRFATRVWLCIYAAREDLEPAWEVEFDSRRDRTGDVWTIFIENAPRVLYYKYRMDGPHAPEEGHHFNPRNFLLDPYAKAFAGNVYDGTIKSVTVAESYYRSGDLRPRTPINETIIYEVHVRGLTKHPSSGVAHPGTYRGLIEKLPYLKDLGVTAIELLPIQEPGETRLGRCSINGREELTNYWGYNSIGFFAPAGNLACSAETCEHLIEFREMVEEVHRAGLEVILDVVFNHTSEGNERGPTLCFRGMINSIFYMLDDNGSYLNYSGCGNTVNCNHPLVRDFILDCLRYWVSVMHVDGFRFDLASILGRDQDGQVVENPPLVERIAEDPVLRDVKLIAEAWDAGGAYQVGSFGDHRWAEWNGRYRDDVRRYWRGDAYTRGAFASRMMGSADVYEWAGRTPEHSINFVTCHDGFTLRDLVSFARKHNWTNGEGNRDGSNDNISINCGVEGETSNAWVNGLRARMQKNYLATLFLSLGVPMLLGGDEFGRTQRGNNNAYCQDNDISWFDWTLLEKNAELHGFCKDLIAFRKAQPALRRPTYFPHVEDAAEAEVVWFDERGSAVDWQSTDTQLAYMIRPRANGGVALYLMFNNTEEDITFRLPPGSWNTRIDTGQDAPRDRYLDAAAAPAQNSAFECRARSVAVLSQ
ncbi:MAG: glycogen debranching protein GlgX [Candidatus Hydrogenedentes bacterium]|nr:glycogen debranching protein GlgX [Candidatus Hydrogenedentota bacterium]